MDNSPEYIKMCEAAEEIQEHKFQNGDFVVLKDNLEVVTTGTYKVYESKNIIEEDYGYDMESYAPEMHCWLPRQDQLQEMINADNVESFLEFCFNWRDDSGGVLDPREYERHKTMEQLWLAYVMKQLHNKTWDGVRWK